VVLALPEDMLTTKASVADTRSYQPVQASPSAAQIDTVRSMLASAKKPLVLLGGGGWNEQACADIQRFAEANHLPVSCAFRFQDLLDNAHPTTSATSASASIRNWRRACAKPM
jgi:acetolactate synthase-1/2/3 large subunit